MNKIHLSGKLFFKNLKSIPYTDCCFKNKDIIKFIKKKKNFNVHTRLILKKRKEEYKLIKKYVDIVFKKVSTNLNTYHQVNSNDKYWKIILYPWLNLYVPFLYLKWKLSKLDKKNKKNLFLTFGYNDKDFIINSLENFRFDEDESLFYSNKALEKCSLKVKKIKIKRIKRNIKDKNNFLFDILWKTFFYLIKIFHKNKSFFLINTSLKKKDLLLIYLRSFKLPFIYKKLNYKQNKIDLNLRKKIFQNKFDEKDDFLNFFYENLYLITPKSYIEDFQNIRKLVNKYYPVGKKNKFFTAFNYKKDDIFKIWVAENSLSKGKYYILQHGGNFGIDEIMNEEDYVKKIADKFLTWGWSDDKQCQKFFNPTLPSRDNKLNIISRKKNFKKKILIIFHYFDKTLFRISSQPNTNYERIKKIYSLSRLSEKLQDKFDITIRYRRKVEEVWDNKFDKSLFPKNLKFDDGSVPFNEVVDLYDLIIFDANSTTFLETCYYNKPSILLVDKNIQKTRKSFNLFNKSFIKNNIVFSDYAKLINFLKKNKDLDNWWYSKSIQILINKFSNKYINTIENKYSKFKKIL
jgi:putative transferase (TIGR04331 family)